MHSGRGGGRRLIVEGNQPSNAKPAPTPAAGPRVKPEPPNQGSGGKK
jgi:hypothetical protein